MHPTMTKPTYKRVLLKLSGEVLMGRQQFGIDPEFVAEVTKAKFEVTPVSGARLEELVLDVYRNTPPGLAKKAAEMMK